MFVHRERGFSKVVLFEKAVFPLARRWVKMELSKNADDTASIYISSEHALEHLGMKRLTVL